MAAQRGSTAAEKRSETFAEMSSLCKEWREIGERDAARNPPGHASASAPEGRDLLVGFLTVPHLGIALCRACRGCRGGGTPQTSQTHQGDVRSPGWRAANPCLPRRAEPSPAEPGAAGPRRAGGGCRPAAGPLQARCSSGPVLYAGPAARRHLRHPPADLAVIIKAGRQSNPLLGVARRGVAVGLKHNLRGY